MPPSANIASLGAADPCSELNCSEIERLWGPSADSSWIEVPPDRVAATRLPRVAAVEARQIAVNVARRSALPKQPEVDRMPKKTAQRSSRAERQI
jgi:hypothetical protein